MENTDNEHITEITTDFIKWFMNLPEKEKDFVSALLIANVPDEKLQRVKSLTQQHGQDLINIFDKAIN